MSRRERRSLGVLFILAVAGHLVRAAVATPAQAPGSLTLFDPASDGDPAAQRRQVEALMRPLGPQERIDADRAGAAELRRLPGIGPSLASKIVADRETRGAFGGMAGLGRVTGIGTALRVKLAPHLQFSGLAADTTSSPALAGPLDLNAATVPELDALPGIGVTRAKAIVAFRDSAGPFRQIDDLRRVPGLTRKVIDAIAPRLILQ